MSSLRAKVWASERLRDRLIIDDELTPTPLGRSRIGFGAAQIVAAQPPHAVLLLVNPGTAVAGMFVADHMEHWDTGVADHTGHWDTGVAGTRVGRLERSRTCHLGTGPDNSTGPDKSIGPGFAAGCTALVDCSNTDRGQRHL